MGTVQCDPCDDECPVLVREVLDLIAAKWAVPIIIELRRVDAPLRYADLSRAVGPITPKELARQLRLLEGSGLIHRRVFPTVPPRVEYSLTELGLSLYPTLESLAKWASHHGGAVRAHRSRRQVRSA